MTELTTSYTGDSAQAPLPRFSWRRIMQLAALYRRPLRAQWLIYAIAIPAIYLGMVFLPDLKPLFTILVSLLTLGAPLVFCRRDNTLIRMAPVTGAERMTFYMVYTFIFVPVVLEIYFTVLQGIGSLISPAGVVHTGIFDLQARALEANLSMHDAVLLFAGSYCISFLVIGMILYGALFGRNPVKAAILYGAGTYAAVMVVVIIYSIVLGFMAAQSLPADIDPDPYQAGFQAGNDFVAQMPAMMLNIGVTTLGLFVILCVKMYRRLR